MRKTLSMILVTCALVFTIPSADAFIDPLNTYTLDPLNMFKDRRYLREGKKITNQNVINFYAEIGKELYPENKWKFMEKSCNYSLKELTKNREAIYVGDLPGNIIQRFELETILEDRYPKKSL